MENFKHYHKKLLQLIEYVISGGAYFWSGYALFALLWSGLHWSLWWSTIVSNVFGWTINYLLQSFWVFNNQSLADSRTQVTKRYVIITLTDFVLNYFILYSLRRAGLTPYIGQFVSAGFFTVWNYFWYRFWVFPDKMTAQKAKIKPSRLIAHRAHGHSGFAGRG